MYKKFISKLLSFNLFAIIILLLPSSIMAANESPAIQKLESLSLKKIEIPTFQQTLEVLLLENYNTRLVVLCTALLGVASGLIGSFLLLRKRSLMSDALSHACLPGIGIAFIIMVSLGYEGKNLAALLAGAVITGLIGIGFILLIRNTSRIKDDTAMGIVLSVFFGIGVAILGMIQVMPSASAAGLEYFIYGKAASMIQQDFILISSVATIIILISILMIKEFTMLCFNEEYARTLGWSTVGMDIIMLALVTSITVAGFQAVGLILIISFLITPPAAARFWTINLKKMLVLAGFIGGISGWLGSTISALFPRLPAGAVIVLVATTIFIISMIFGTERGVLFRYIQHIKLQKKIGHQNLLRAIYELLEHNCVIKTENLVKNVSVPVQNITNKRSWTQQEVIKLIKDAKKEDDIEYFNKKEVLLSESGFGEASRLTRNHRLWEIYLLAHADIAPHHVDRDADRVEHILGPAMVHELEEEIIRRGWKHPMPESPHIISPLIK